jgi:hypothetical protein
MYDFDLETAPSKLEYNLLQQAMYKLLRAPICYMRFNSFLMFLKNEILVANKIVYGSFGISGALPDNQSQTEMENIHNTSLAGLQQNLINHAAAPNVRIRPGLDLHSYMVPENRPWRPASLCQPEIPHLDVFLLQHVWPPPHRPRQRRHHYSQPLPPKYRALIPAQFKQGRDSTTCLEGRRHPAVAAHRA